MHAIAVCVADVLVIKDLIKHASGKKKGKQKTCRLFTAMSPLISIFTFQILARQF